MWLFLGDPMTISTYIPLLNRISAGLVVLILTVLSLSAFGQSDYVVLQPNRSVERELKAGEIHNYRLTIEAEQYLYAIIDQRGIDVGVTLFAPDGAKLFEIDRTSSQLGDESLWYIFSSSGEYRLEVRSLKKAAPPGRYELKIAELRTAVPQDAIVVAAGKAMNKADILSALQSEETSAKAIEICKAGAERFRETGDPRNQARALETIGRIYQLGYKTGPAIEYNQQALKLYNALGLKIDEVAILVRLGVISANSVDYLRAIDYYENAISLAEAINDKRAIAVIKNNLALIQEELGDLDEAEKNFQESMKMAKEIDMMDLVANALNNLGNLYRRKGNFALALEFQQMNLSISTNLGDETQIARALGSISVIHSDQGNNDLSLKYAEQALQNARKANDADLVARALNSIGGYYSNRKDFTKALDYLNQANQIFDDNGIINNVALGNIGHVYLYQENYTKALEYLQKALNISEGKDAWVIHQMANAYAAQENYAKSVEFDTRSIELAKSSGLSDVLSAAYASRGWTNLALGKPIEAQQDLKEAISMYEDFRLHSAGGAGGEMQSFSQHLSPYYSMVELMTLQNSPNEAFEYSEHTKSRLLLDVLQGNRINVNKAMTLQEREQERRLKNELASLKIQIPEQQDSSRVGNLQKQLDRKRIDFEDFQIRLYASHPELRIQRGEMKPISLADSAALLTDVKSAVAEFVVADDKTFLFVITQDAAKKASLKAFTIDVKDKDLTKRIEAYRSKLAAGDLDFQKEGRELYDLLLKPAQAQLSGKTNFIIVPDGPLWDLPFQALMDDKGKYLIDKAAISYAPSLAALREMRKKALLRKPSPDAELVAFGNPTVAKETTERLHRVFMSEKLEPLPEAERLVNSLAAMYGPKRSKVFTGADARETVAKSESPKYRIIQFATHGLLNNTSPMYSHLVLAQNEKDPNEDGLLEAWELKDLDLKADMVILSACETARGKISNGEGVIGMTWASFIAGAPTTVASQWKVESRSTTELMLEFHRQLLTAKVSKAEALRRASLKLMKTPKYKHPSYWAGFVIIGDGS